MAFGRNTFHFTSDLSIADVKKRLTSNTIEKNNAVREKPGKPFTGTVDNNSFNITSSATLGFACILHGRLARGNGKNNTHIDLETRTQRIFIWLLVIWMIVVTSAAIVPELLKSTYVFSPLPFLLLIFGAVAFRLFIHGLYIMARNKAINQFKQVLTT